MTIDAHLHVWDPTRAAYPWLTPQLHPLDRTIVLDDIVADLDIAGVDRVVLVQAADNAADTAVMRAEAARHPNRVAAIVGWLPLDDPDTTAAGIEEFTTDPLLVGVRNLIHDREPGWITGPAQNASLELLAGAGLTLDFVTASADALGELPGIIERHPDLRIVIDHLGKPPIGGTVGERNAWRSLLASAAQHPLVYAKLSGLYPPSGDARAWTVDLVRPFVEDAREIFGADRLMYGSDWPIAERAGGHRRVHDSFEALTNTWADTELRAVTSGTVAAFYRISETPTIERTTV